MVDFFCLKIANTSLPPFFTNIFFTIFLNFFCHLALKQSYCTQLFGRIDKIRHVVTSLKSMVIPNQVNVYGTPITYKSYFLIWSNLQGHTNMYNNVPIPSKKLGLTTVYELRTRSYQILELSPMNVQPNRFNQLGMLLYMTRDCLTSHTKSQNHEILR